jgi:hypothetical protein
MDVQLGIVSIGSVEALLAMDATIGHSSDCDRILQITLKPAHAFETGADCRVSYPSWHPFSTIPATRHRQLGISNSYCVQGSYNCMMSQGLIIY